MVEGGTHTGTDGTKDVQALGTGLTPGFPGVKARDNNTTPSCPLSQLSFMCGVCLHVHQCTVSDVHRDQKRPLDTLKLQAVVNHYVDNGNQTSIQVSWKSNQSS